MQRWWFSVIAAGVWGCSPAPGDRAELPPDARVELCGDGVIGHGDDGVWEDCDEGVFNGTSTARCTTECIPAMPALPTSTRQVDLGLPIKQITRLRTQFYLGVATTHLGDPRVQVWRSQPPPGQPELMWLPAQAPVVAVADVVTQSGGGPAWIEMNPGEAPQLYFADLEDSGPVIHELPYPFPDGLRPEVTARSSVDDRGLMILDHNAAGELLVAMVIARSPTDVVTFAQRLPAPPGSRGVTVDTGWYHDEVEAGNRSRQLVVFFDDPGSFVSIDVRSTHDGDLFATFSTIQFSEVVRAPWPYRVVGGDLFLKRCVRENRSFRQPVPLAIVADQGDVVVWQFDKGLSGEAFTTPFAHVVASTRSIVGGAEGVWMLEADGTSSRFTDGDCRNLRSSALVPSRVALTQPSTNARLGLAGWLATAGSVLYLY